MYYLPFHLQSWRNYVGGKESTDSGRKSIAILISHILPHLLRTLNVLTNTEEGQFGILLRKHGITVLSRHLNLYYIFVIEDPKDELYSRI